MESHKDEREEKERERRRRIRGIIQDFRQRVNQICGPVGETTDFLDQVIEIGGAIRDFLRQEDLLDEEVRRHLQETLDELEKVRDGIQPLSDACGKITRALDLADQVLSSSPSIITGKRVAAIAGAIAALIGGVIVGAVALSNLSSSAQPVPPIIVEPTVPTPVPLAPIVPQVTPTQPTPTPTPAPLPQPTATPSFRPANTLSPDLIALPPVALFRGTPLQGGCQFRVLFFDASTNASSYFWDFGDGTTSTERDPVHTYIQTSEGLLAYTVTLTVGGPGGQDAESKVDYVTSQCIR